MVSAQAKFTVSVYNNSLTQTPGMLGGTSAIAGGSPGAYGYYPPISTAAGGGLGPMSAVTGPGGLPTTASPMHGLGHMTNIQVPATIFPGSNFKVLTVFTYGGADVAAYSTRITIPGLGIMNNMSQSASVTGGGAATVQNEMATPQVLPYGQIPGTVELVRLGGTLTVDDVQPITINAPGGVGISGVPGIPPGPFPVGGGVPPPSSPGTPPQGIPPTAVSSGTAAVTSGTASAPATPPIVIPPPPGAPPGTPPVVIPTSPTPTTPATTLPTQPQTPTDPSVPPTPPVVIPPPPGAPAGTPPTVIPTTPANASTIRAQVAASLTAAGIPVPPSLLTPAQPPVVQIPVVINVTRSMNGGYVTLVATGTGFRPGERVLMSIGLNNRDHRYDWRWSHRRHSHVETATADGQVMHTFTVNSRSQQQISGHLHMRGLMSNKSGQKQFTL